MQGSWKKVQFTVKRNITVMPAVVVKSHSFIRLPNPSTTDNLFFIFIGATMHVLSLSTLI